MHAAPFTAPADYSDCGRCSQGRAIGHARLCTAGMRCCGFLRLGRRGHAETAAIAAPVGGCAGPGWAPRALSLAAFMRSLASDSPVSALLHSGGLRLLQACLDAAGTAAGAELSRTQLRELRADSPLVAQVISMFSGWGAHGFLIGVWRTFWGEVISIARLCGEGPDAGPLLSAPERAGRPRGSATHACARASAAGSPACASGTRVRWMPRRLSCR